VQELVKLHGGTVRAESEVGEGSRFIVRVPFGSRHLPADRLGASERRRRFAQRAAPFVEEALRWLPWPASGIQPELPIDAPIPNRCRMARTAADARLRILVVDDNADMRDYLVRLLGEQWDVEAVGDGDTALAAALDHPPAVVVSDVMMPGLDGFQLLAALRKNERTHTISVIILSARAEARRPRKGWPRARTIIWSNLSLGVSSWRACRRKPRSPGFGARCSRGSGTRGASSSEALVRERRARALADENARIAETLSRLSALGRQAVEGDPRTRSGAHRAR